MEPTVDKQSLSNVEYLERIAAVSSAWNARVRVRVTPYEQARLVMSFQGHVPNLDHECFSRRVFMLDCLGAAEWMWDNTIVEPVIEPING